MRCSPASQESLLEQSMSNFFVLVGCDPSTDVLVASLTFDILAFKPAGSFFVTTVT
jgi:hypothetical protein